MDWNRFKKRTERNFSRAKINKSVWGYQIEPGSKWNKGLTQNQIEKLEKLMGFELPTDYKSMLSTMNGLDHDQRAVDPTGTLDDEFGTNLYRYPNDFKRTRWLLKKIHENIKHVKKALANSDFDTKKIVGFVPLYAHRALVVFKDKSLSPVVSVWGDDVIVYGNNLWDYWHNEFELTRR